MLRMAILGLSMTILSACTTARDALPAPSSLDLQRFMGDWYVIGFIPLFPERDAHNGIESYQLKDDGGIAVAYHFRDGSFDAPLKTYRPSATVVEGTENTQWKMQFLWPFKADYRVAYISEDYSETIIGREKRDYVWLMARSPQLSETRYQELLVRIAEMGYDLSEFKRQPQRWPEAQPRPPAFPK